jgi:hypothetical protein
VACDLDQTLIFSPRLCRLADPPVPMVPVEVLDGAPIAFATARSLELMAALAGAATFVPVTTRTRSQFARVRLGPVRGPVPDGAGPAPALAVTTNGGSLLVDGEPDEEWTAAVGAAIAASARPVAEVAALAERLVGDGWARVSRVADGLFVYVVAHSREAIPDLGELARSLAADGWRLSVQGRKVYLVPAALTKEAAVAEVMRRVGATALAAAGDSLLDAGLLARADLAVRPAHGELHEQGWTAPGLRVTGTAGPLAGEEICELLLAAATAPAGPEMPAGSAVPG